MVQHRVCAYGRNMTPGTRTLTVPEVWHDRSRSGDAIVVGYAGGPGSRAAIERAGRRAGATGSVFVVCAYRLPPSRLGSPYYEQRLQRQRSEAVCLLSELFGRRSQLPKTEYVPELIGGMPADAILRVAVTRGAAAVLVGESRSRLGRLIGVPRKLRRATSIPVVTVSGSKPPGIAPADSTTPGAEPRLPAGRQSASRDN